MVDQQKSRTGWTVVELVSLIAKIERFPCTGDLDETSGMRDFRDLDVLDDESVNIVLQSFDYIVEIEIDRKERGVEG